MTDLADRLGIMQGRLIESRTGALDCPPGSRWREEFGIAATLGLHHIELVAERVVDPANPMWSTTGRRELVAEANDNGVNLTSLCVNEPLNTRFDDADLGSDLAGRLADVLDEVGATIVVLPLLEASDLSVLDWSGAARCVRRLAADLDSHGAQLVLEVGVPAVEAARFLDATAPQIGLCYDLGNATASGFDVPAELGMLGSRVRHVHAKDKDAAGQNVRFGTGGVAFGAAFAALADQGFDGLVTMEATRGDDPVITAAEHRSFLLSCDDEAMTGGESGR